MISMFSAVGKGIEGLTLASLPPMVDAGTGNQDITDYGKDALACNPMAMLVPDSKIVQPRGLIMSNRARIDRTRLRQLIRVEELPYWPFEHLWRQVAKDIFYRTGDVAGAGIRREICPLSLEPYHEQQRETGLGMLVQELQSYSKRGRQYKT